MMLYLYANQVSEIIMYFLITLITKKHFYIISGSINIICLKVFLFTSTSLLQ